MLVVRAISEQDVDGLMNLAMQAGSGMTTFKPNRHAMEKRVEIACKSFSGEIPAERRDYMFVMEDVRSAEVVGVSAIKGAVGVDEPFYNYRIGTLVHSSRDAGVFSRMNTLYLSNDLTGCSELCSLFLHPEYRNGYHGKLLSKCRLMFIAHHQALFGNKLIAEMRGYLDASGKSPFWEGLGRHFFKMEFDRADDLTSLGEKAFIAELMPRHPVYVDYLPKSAQDVIGMVQAETAPARRLLEQEGMYYEGYVDIFDAGPVMQARVSELRAVRESRLVEVIGKEVEDTEGEPMLVANTGMSNFRVIVSSQAPDANAISLQRDQQALLLLKDGDIVRTMSLNTRKSVHA